ncbi:hypothetical protein Tco_0712932 [Tanacetum coccineum]
MADFKSNTTMDELVTKNQANYYSRITSITVNGKVAYELKGKFLDDLRDNAFSGTNREDAVEHIEYFFKIVDPIDVPNVNYERLRLVVFPISLVGYASKCFDEFRGSITTWVDLTENFLGKSAFSYLIIDPFTKKVLWDFWKKGDNQKGVTDEEFSDLKKANNDDEHKIAEIFMIETNLFDYETPLYIKFNKFNYLLKVDMELFTHDIERTKTYEDYQNE